MTRNGAPTRQRILDGAERLVLEYGLGATTVDAILRETNSSKGAFFHHFPSKNHLARALVERYATADLSLLEGHLAQAREVSDDPAIQMVTFLRLFEESADEIVAQHPSCLYVTYMFDKDLFDDGTNDVILRTLTTWRERLVETLHRAAQAHPPRSPVDLDAVADHVVTTFEGAFILTRAMNDSSLMRRQLGIVRHYLAMLFDVPVDPASAQST
ncbi:TetR/AcrR family transcriptional regulator [Nesterenkonia muleiensis]|uniref:TetR/AcrR family transcriptional regulator n=1 Tax=Nesterenkonia muleiensis TaxID=2282648 RepID=UPI000E73319B|nr:TetR/AcrR family transcriptional regulator [Nesterenkonia muleiensis]